LPDYRSINVNQGNQFRSLVQLARVTKADDDMQFDIQSLHVYPNPGTDVITIEYPLMSGLVTWTITDMQGGIIRKWKDVLHQQSQSLTGLMKIDVSDIPSGAYIFALTNATTSISTQCTITH